MMNWYRITKFNPEYRDENGAYTRDDWIAISDTWTKKDDYYIPSQEYLKIEQEYIDTILYIMRINNTTELEVIFFGISLHSKYSDLNFESYIKQIAGLYNGKKLSKEQLPNMVMFTLREAMGCQFKADNFSIHFGYDYYMYVGCLAELSQSVIQKRCPNIFVENISISPWMKEERDEDDYIQTCKENIYHYHVNYRNLALDESLYFPINWEKTDNGLRIPTQEYLLLEEAYSTFFTEMMNQNKVKYLETRGLVINHNYNYSDISFFSFFQNFAGLSENDMLVPREILVLSKMILRGEMNCKLESYNCFIHFHDIFNVYIGCTTKIDINSFNGDHLNMQLTEKISPYLLENNYYKLTDKQWLYYPDFRDYHGEDLLRDDSD